MAVNVAGGPAAGRSRLACKATPFLRQPASRKDTSRSVWDVLVFSTPALDQLNQAWGMAAGANGAAMGLSRVPAMAGSIATSPVAGILGKAGLLGHIERLLGTRAFQAIAGVLSKPIFQAAGRIAGRIAPFIGAGFTFFDIRNAYRTQQDPGASDLRKALKWLKAGITAFGTAAGFATLFLAPTGVGAVVAGCLAMGAGFAAMGLDFLISRIAPR